MPILGSKEPPDTRSERMPVYGREDKPKRIRIIKKEVTPDTVKTEIYQKKFLKEGLSKNQNNRK